MDCLSLPAQHIQPGRFTSTTKKQYATPQHGEETGPRLRLHLGPKYYPGRRARQIALEPRDRAVDDAVLDAL